MKAGTVTSGKSFPLGATYTSEGVNFCVFSKNSRRLELLLFNHVDETKPFTVISLDSWKNRTYHYWHVFVPGLRPGQIYGYRADGPFEPQRGLRFDPEKVLLDMNIAGSGKFSSDRTIAEYAADIWNVKACPIL